MTSIGPVEAAQAALDARQGGRAAAVVMAVPAEASPTPPPEPRDAAADRVPASSSGATPGARLLLYDDGEVRGSLGSAELDTAATALGRRALEAGRPLREPAPAAPELALVAEPHHAEATLLIVGAGHIAVPLARVGAILGFRVTVLDDRDDFATAERFPDAVEVRRVDFADPFASVRLDGRTHVVLVTRAHRYDYDCLLGLMRHDARPAYIGMVGSRRRVRATFESLLEAGVPRDRLADVHSPIGLDIGAETPEEIAVSIASELVAVRRSHGSARLDGEGAGGRGGDGATASLAAKERVLDRLVRTDDAGNEEHDDG